MKLRRKTLLHSLFLVGGSVVFVSVFLVGIKNVFRYNVFKQEYKRLFEQYDKDQQTNLAYKAVIQEAKDLSYWDMQARRRMGFVKQNETVYKFVYRFRPGR